MLLVHESVCHTLGSMRDTHVVGAWVGSIHQIGKLYRPIFGLVGIILVDILLVHVKYAALSRLAAAVAIKSTDHEICLDGTRVQRIIIVVPGLTAEEFGVVRDCSPRNSRYQNGGHQGQQRGRR